MLHLRHLVAAIAVFRALPATAMAADHAPFDALLTRYVIISPDGVNRVRYGAWRANAADRAALDAHVASLERERPSRLSRD